MEAAKLYGPAAVNFLLTSGAIFWLRSSHNALALKVAELEKADAVNKEDIKKLHGSLVALWNYVGPPPQEETAPPRAPPKRAAPAKAAPAKAAPKAAAKAARAASPPPEPTEEELERELDQVLASGGEDGEAEEELAEEPETPKPRATRKKN